MVRLPLIINGQRLRTLEELHENFNLTELIERYRGGQLRAWLNNWDFSSELEQVEALSPDLPEQELLEALCHIFMVEGDAKEQALAVFKEEQTQREQERQREAKYQQEQQKQKERETKRIKSLTLKDIKFDWQEADGPWQEYPGGKLLTAGTDRFVAIQDQQIIFYSYDGIHWEEVPSRMEEMLSSLYYCNSYFICFRENFDKFHYSADSIHWKTTKIDGVSEIKKIIWANGLYMALCSQEKEFHYTEKVLFMDMDKTSTWNSSVIYTAPDLSGPWHKEKLTALENGEYFYDITFFNNSFIADETYDHDYVFYTNRAAPRLFYCKGTSISKLDKCAEKSLCIGRRLWKSEKMCFSYHEEWDDASVTYDGKKWNEIPLPIEELIEADRFVVAHMYDRGFHVSLNGIKWKKLNAPLQDGKMAYLNGKLLIADENKIAVGTLKTVNDNTKNSQ